MTESWNTQGAADGHRQALEHLRAVDPKIAAVIDSVGDCRYGAREEGTHFGALVRSIVYQQLSGKAAGTIHGRLRALYGDRDPTPAELIATPEAILRGVGLSRQKMSYLLDLASRVERGDLPLDDVHDLDDDTLTTKLVEVKGIGRWTAQMFMMFRLGRVDILPDLDLGIQKGLQRAYRLRKMPKPKDVLRLGAKWAPYRTIASWYLWRLVDNVAPTARKKAGGAKKKVAEKKGAAKKGAVKKRAARKAVSKKASAKKRSVMAAKRRGSKRPAVRVKRG
jgi:3-methyladenine DNA glycosylase/8-oxoguanine DNA glycosylase